MTKYDEIVQDFCKLIREYGVKEVAQDLRHLDPVQFEEFIKEANDQLLRCKKVAAIFRS